MPLTERFQAALVHAAELHAQQQRKTTGAPYVAHLLGVASLVLEHGGDEDQAIAALLHDAVEDQGGRDTLGEIQISFGRRVAELVEGCSEIWQPPKPPWKERKDAFLARLADASPEAKLIVAADKLHNVRSLLADHVVLGSAIWEHFHGGREGTVWYHRAVLKLVQDHIPRPLAGMLASAIEDLAQIAAEDGRE